MGFGDVVGPLVELAKESFKLSQFMAQLLPVAGLLMFGVLSVPMGILQDRLGKKPLLMFGLLVALAGLVVPMLAGMYGPKLEIVSGDATQFYVLLGAILLLGTGATVLQVVGNPLIRDVSPAGACSRNLSLAQAIKAIGSSLGFLLPPLAVWASKRLDLGVHLDWPILFPVYAVIIAITIILNVPLQIHETRDPGAKPATLGSCFSLLFGNPFVLMMVLGIFFYVGAEVCLSTEVPTLLNENFHVHNFLWLSWCLFFLAILAGRFAGAAVLRTMSAKRFFVLTAILALAGIACVLSGQRTLAFVGIFLAGLGFANIFPLIFSITIDAMPSRSNEIAGLMVSAIVGGAVLPPIMGFVTDKSSVLRSFLVPLAAIAYIVVVSLVNDRFAPRVSVNASGRGTR